MDLALCQDKKIKEMSISKPFWNICTQLSFVASPRFPSIFAWGYVPEKFEIREYQNPLLLLLEWLNLKMPVDTIISFVKL